ncbi:glycoside hydrolase family 3 C-terminal domain-containing protein [Pedobacter sp. MW01-1-1]|uniref:glycoside hydrolase family 3 C-terminal domain-containing protein n=1 Tax=Pedobacter sp. MW01-1-1 TaxID=3383027 RepID=UPI003FEEA578
MRKILIVFSLTFPILAFAQEYKKYPMWDSNLPREQRIDDLVKRLTLEEKVFQMLNAAPAIPRLGIPAYDWWNEVLHGVARTPYPVTVYPQAIAMAATWDTTSLHRMADYSALEGRAIFAKANQEDKAYKRYLGLTYWTPNINIFRDPRWGRGQETYGEDPFLTAMLGKAFVHGLQGDDPNYLKAAACAKHFAVHSGPEPSRHSFNAEIGDLDLWNTYLPAFKELIVKSNVAGVMCAYNAFRTQPCCGSDLLMNDILRNQWGFNGYVTSDCWAIDDFFKFHKTHPDAKAAAIDAVMHGTDLECGVNVYHTLINAVKEGNLTEKQIDISVKRLFEIRYKLGFFDPVEKVKYAQTPASAIEAPEHSEHALKMARQSIVLLKNENNTLPLRKDLKKIAVIGPNADNSIAILGNYNGFPSHLSTLLAGIKSKVPNAEVRFEKAINFTNDTLLQYRDISAWYSFEGKTGVKAEYFNNQELQGAPVHVVQEKDINHQWAEGQMPYPNVPAYRFSARYSTSIAAEMNEVLTFEVNADDGYRVFVNGKSVVDSWARNRWGAKQFNINAEKGKVYTIVVETNQNEGAASVKLACGKFVKTDFQALAKRLADVDAIVFVGGISPQLEGEEMKVPYPGFDGGDRTSILLPEVQTRLLKALKSTGKPLVMAMLTGSAIAIPWESENIPAIVNAWYGGQAAGKAFADVLFGDYNPAGRLPVTFYKNDDDLPPFENYNMTGRTYRYFQGNALYPFGYGLSYTTFKYQHITLQNQLAEAGKITVEATVKNEGKMDGEEVVQLYVAFKGQKQAPIRSLKAFKRISLKAGESQVIRFTLDKESISLLDENGKPYLPNSEMDISIGGGQPVKTKQFTSNFLQSSIQLN